MISGFGPRDMRNGAHCFEQPNLFDNADILIEISVAALTTEPELRDIGRSLISLARYHACKTLKLTTEIPTLTSETVDVSQVRAWHLRPRSPVEAIPTGLTPHTKRGYCELSEARGY